MNAIVLSESGEEILSGSLDGEFRIGAAAVKNAGRKITIRHGVPIRDMAGYFSPATSNGPVMHLDWIISFDGYSSRNFPALCFFNQAGENRHAFFFDNLVDDFTCTARMNQAACTYDIEWTFAVTPKTPAMTLRADSRGGHWTHAFARLFAVLRPQGLPSFPAGAWKPVYCTWYAAHAWLTNEFLDANARLAASLGCGTFIVDDGWCYDEMKRVSPATLPTWYDEIGDWELSEKKLPDFRAHVRYAQSLGLKYLLWVAPYFCFRNSRFYKSLEKDARDIPAAHDTFVFDIARKDIVSTVIARMRRLVRGLGLDGLKVDFLDVAGADLDKPLGRTSLDFIRRLAATIRREAGPEALIEFRQRYATPQMLDYGTQFRAGDVPFDYLLNLSRLAAMRVLLGDGVPLHADPLYWGPDEIDTAVARHLIAAMAGVPMLSMDLARLPPVHLRIVANYLAFYRENETLFARGHWEVRFAGSLPSWLSVTRGGTRIAIVADAKRADEAVGGFKGTCHILNLSAEKIPAATAYDPSGRKVTGRAIPCGGRGTV